MPPIKSSSPSKKATAELFEGQVFRLYVSSASPASSRAVVNVRRFLEVNLPGIYRLNVLDISSHVASARADQVVASPTLIRVLPLPQRRFIGDMSDTSRLRSSLGLASPPAG
jgi:circadian clock protein KaiB